MDNNNRRIEQVYNEYKDHIYNYIYRMCNDRQLALDIVQQTFVKVLSKPDVLEVEHLKAYLFTIARNKLHDEWKQKSPVSLEGDNEMLNDVDNSAPDDVHQDAEQKATKNAVVNAIKQLPHNLRELMLLRYIEDLSVTEIADITARTVTDIKVSLHRARLKFEQKLTALMYSKVAVARNRCKTLTDLLLPFGMNNIPEQQLAAINKHIIKCEVCVKDSEEMKKSKQLFTALPMLPFPIAFDELAQSLPQSAASVPVADKQDISSAIDSGSSVAEKSMTAKVVGGSLAVVVAVSSALYFGSNSSSSSVTQQAQQSAKPTKPVTKTAENKNVGTIKLQSSIGKTKSALSANVEWNIFPSGGSTKQSRIKSADSKKGSSASFNLLPGKYTAVAQLGDVKQSQKFEIKKQQTQTRSVEFDLGLLDINLAQNLNKDIDVTKVQWIVSAQKKPQNKAGSKTKKKIGRSSFTGNKLHYLSPGEYQLSAKYADNLSKSVTLNIIAGQKASLGNFAFDYTKLLLNATLGGKAEKLPKGALTWQLAQKRGKKFQTIRQKNLASNAYLLAPGEYRVTAQLGDTVRHSQQVSINKGQSEKRLNIKVAAGKLSLSAKTANNNPILSSAMAWSIYDTDKKKPKLVYSSGELDPQLYLPVGSYRVTAKAGINAAISRNVDIAEGKSKKMQPFVFNPGALKLAAKSDVNKSLISKNIQWLLEKETDTAGYKRLKAPKQPQPLLVLMPGRYRITANYADRFKQSYQFTIEAGKVSEYTLLINDDTRPSAWR